MNIQKNDFPVIYKAPIIIFFSICYAILFVDIVYIVLSYMSDIGIKDGLSFYSILQTDWFIYLCLIVFHIVFILYFFMRWRFDYYRVEEGHIIHRKWIFFRKTEQVNIQKITEITVDDGFFGRFFNYGNIKINFMGDEFKIPQISDPRSFSAFLSAYINNETLDIWNKTS